MIGTENLSDFFIGSRLGSLRGKALVRVDVNVPVRNGEVNRSNLRFKACAKSIEEYCNNGIIPIILGHQGRKGDSDYLESMEQHASVLESLMHGVKVKYSNSLDDPATERAAAGLKEGEALMLKNMRDHPDEKKKFGSAAERSNSALVKSLSKLADFYINDAPATMHRSDTSLIGFVPVMPSYIGLQMEEELGVLNEIRSNLKSGDRTVIIFGGKKWEKFEYIYEIAKNRNVKLLCGGIPGQSLCYVRNRRNFNSDNEKYLVENGGEFDTASKLMENFYDRVLQPVDFVLEGGENVSVEDLINKKGSIMDIGEETVNNFFKAIEEAETIIYAGPVGRYEKGYNQTVRLITRFMGSQAHNYTLGGNSADSMDDIGLEKAYEMLKGKRITAGGAGLAFIADAELPVLSAFLSSKMRPGA